MSGHRYDSGVTQPLTSPPDEPALDPAPKVGRLPADPLTSVRARERYAILGEHGRGALGRVSRAHDTELGRDVAIKELIARDPASEVRFLREAVITARLEHPGIVAVHEAGRWPDGTPFYAMRLVSGRSLRELISERTTVTARLGLLHHVLAVTDAIAYAHARNVIHRDLKPANVVVGDCGETVVVDWGLAKDLATPEEPAPADRQRTRSGSELTAAGTVLGTPAYMAPEQARGEPVDQRADVFAIGVMLWELCTLTRIPPPQPRGRRRTLREAGIDDDLAIIVDRALATDPGQRYPDAGALAGDLKAFKAGARIASRRYSLAALLGHWVRRHRAIAGSAIGASLAVAALAVVSIRNIVAARDRAETAHDESVLARAELLLHTDPTAARAVLRGYHGADELRRRRLIAEAEGRGVARAVLTPHSDTIWFLVGDATGAIISIGEDGKIRRTQAALAPGAPSTVLAADVSNARTVVYCPAARLVAYATAPTGISILDLQTLATRRISTINPADLAFSPDGTRLVALDRRGALTVWATTPDATPLHRVTVPGARELQFMTPTRLLVSTGAGLQIVELGGRDGLAKLGDPVEVAGLTAFAVQPDAVAAGTADGRLVILSSGLAPLGETRVCRATVQVVHFIARSDRLALGCADPVFAIARLDRVPGGVTTEQTFEVHGPSRLEADRDGRYLTMFDESGTASVYDAETDLITRYDGNAGRPSFVAAPTPEFDHVLVGDVNGTVRVWDPPTRAARVAVRAPSSIFALAFSRDGATIYAAGDDGVIRSAATAGGAVTQLLGHKEAVTGLRTAPDGSSVLSFGYDGTARVWRTRDGAPSRVLTRHASVVQDAEYFDAGHQVVSVGDDGQLLRWSTEGDDVAVLFKHSAPLTGVEPLRYSGHAVIKDAAGSVWDVSATGVSRTVLDASGRDAKGRDAKSAPITVLRASPAGHFLAVGTELGMVTIYDTASWRILGIVYTEGSVRQIVFDPLERDLIIASEAGRSQDGHVEVVALAAARRFPWRRVAADVRDAGYSPDGGSIAFVCADGSAWGYEVDHDAWSYTRDHDTDTYHAKFSPDGRWYASADRHGVAVIRDVTASTSRARPHAPQPHH